MANDIDRVMVSGPHGAVWVPSAKSYNAAMCGDPLCKVIHLISKDAQGVPICETTFSVAQLRKMIELYPG